MKKYWQASSLITKFQMILIVAMFFYIQFSGIYYRGIISNQRNKAIKKAVDSLALIQQRKDSIFLNKQRYRNSVRKKSIQIDKKLQQDEKEINSRPVTNERRQRYLSKHQKR